MRRPPAAAPPDKSATTQDARLSRAEGRGGGASPPVPRGRPDQATAAVPPNGDDTNAVEIFCRAHRRKLLAAVLALAAMLRIVYFAQVASGPLLWQHLATETDMNFFDAWARALAAGDWLNRAGHHPRHVWHTVLANRYLAFNPAAADGLSTTADEAGGSPATRALWERWWGGKRFHQEPLYPYLLAATYACISTDVRAVIAWQMALGVATVLLAYWLGRSAFGEAAGLCGALLLTLCGPLLFYEATILRTTTACFVLLLATLMLGRAGAKPTPWRAALAGLAGGVLVTLEVKYGLVVLGGLALLAWRGLRGGAASARGRYARLGPPLFYAAGMAAALLPVVARNVSVGVGPLALSSVGVPSFVCMNTVDAPITGDFVADSEHAARVLGDSGGRALPAMLGAIGTHNGVGNYLGYLARRAALAWHVHEFPNNVNFYYYRLQAGVLWLTPVNFALLAPLGVVGALWALASWPSRRRLTKTPERDPVRGQHMPAVADSGATRDPDPYRDAAAVYVATRGATRIALLVGLVATVLPLVLFSVLARYRAPAWPILAIFAGQALLLFFDWARRRRIMSLCGGGVLAAALAVAALRPLVPAPTEITPFDCAVPFRYFYEPRLAAAQQRNDRIAEERLLRDFLAAVPPVVRAARPDRPPATRDAALLTQMFGDLTRRHAEVLSALGKATEALSLAERARDWLAAAQAAPVRGSSSPR